MLSPSEIEHFEDAQPRLLGLAYRILGSRAEAEDAVQDTFLKWADTDRTAIRNLEGWLTTTCTRRCLDLLRSAHRTRMTYPGEWLPEPIHTPLEAEASGESELASTLTTAFLLMLERLTPKQRAAFLLREIFGASYASVAETLEIEESTCRKLVSRAKANLDDPRIRSQISVARQDQLLTAFQEAIQSGTIERLADHLAEDIRLTADGGGKALAARQIIAGREKVMTFVQRLLAVFWGAYQWRRTDINGRRGWLLENQGKVDAVVSFAYDEDERITDIFIVRNPDKLTRLEPVEIR